MTPSTRSTSHYVDTNDNGGVRHSQAHGRTCVKSNFVIACFWSASFLLDISSFLELIGNIRRESSPFIGSTLTFHVSFPSSSTSVNTHPIQANHTATLMTILTFFWQKSNGTAVVTVRRRMHPLYILLLARRPWPQSALHFFSPATERDR